jgi:RNA polymerase sigma-70 factor (ECF subfamily)
MGASRDLPPRARKPAARLQLDPRLSARIARARAAWPELTVDETAFVRELAARIANGGQGKALATLHIEDLYLAFACVAGDAHALAHVEALLASQVSAYLAPLHTSPEIADEVRQILRIRLFVAGPRSQRPWLASYSGRGALGAWLRISAVRVAQDLLRARKPHAPIDDSLRATSADPELDYLKKRYASEFREAFAAVLAGLPAKQRNILSLYFLDGMTTQAIGALYRVDATTVGRWLARLRQSILDSTHRALAERVQAQGSEVESLIRLVRSQLEVSICRFLQANDKGP